MTYHLKHTPLSNAGSLVLCSDGTPYCVVDMSRSLDERMEMTLNIVKAMNLHAKMLEALKALEYDEYGLPVEFPSQEAVRALIAEAQ